MLDNMLDYFRIALYTLLLFLGFLLFQAWNKDFPPSPIVSTTPDTSAVSDRFVPNTNIASQTAAPAVTTTVPKVSASASGQLVHVKTDVLEVNLDTQGGDVVDVKLLNYPDKLDSKTPFVLLNDSDQNRYIAESGLLSTQGPDTSSSQALYTTTQSSYDLGSQQQLLVKLNWHNDQGLNVTKWFAFTRGSYEIKVGYDIQNQSSQPWQGNFYAQLLRADVPPENHGGIVNLTTFFGAAFSSPQKPFEKMSFKDMRERDLHQVIENGWVAMIQHYFISAWVPPANSPSTYYTKVTPNGLYAIGTITPTLKVDPGQSASTSAKLYTGPTIADQLGKTAPTLKLTIDYGWLSLVSDLIFWMMQKIYDVVGNWGWSIVIVTIIIKLLFYHLSAKSYRSMTGLKNLQPKIEALKERFGDDRQKLTQATLELYRQEKVNPMSGCLPILVQIPVFIALYWVLVESVQLRQAPFMLWIRDLSQADPYYVLPLLMGVSMYLQQRLNPPPPDPMQARVMQFMPVVFTLLFANFPAGLMLYWFVNNTLSFLQQWHIMHHIKKQGSTKSVVKSKK